ncbi:hypothetical protein M514_08088 [Trichuris suis]|uniref:Uncharacterized protein n=1 Tax=Trichuris suis TaxID=68888 RepID=A0A085NUW6_9BILA|nr:hypothetical protein M514_08088 [Trichuris suis]
MTNDLRTGERRKGCLDPNAVNAQATRHFQSTPLCSFSANREHAVICIVVSSSGAALRREIAKSLIGYGPSFASWSCEHWFTTETLAEFATLCRRLRLSVCQ